MCIVYVIHTLYNTHACYIQTIPPLHGLGLYDVERVYIGVPGLHRTLQQSIYIRILYILHTPLYKVYKQTWSLYCMFTKLMRIQPLS